MREAYEVHHGDNMMRYESERDLRTRQWKELNEHLKQALQLIKEGNK